MDQIEPTSSLFQKFLGTIGVLFVLAGVCLFGLYLYFAGMVLNSPAKMASIKSKLMLTEPAIRGTYEAPMADGSEGVQMMKFEMTLSEEFSMLLFILLVFFSILICVGILRIIIGAGSTMVKAASTPKQVIIREREVQVRSSASASYKASAKPAEEPLAAKASTYRRDRKL